MFTGHLFQITECWNTNYLLEASKYSKFNFLFFDKSLKLREIQLRITFVFDRKMGFITLEKQCNTSNFMVFLNMAISFCYSQAIDDYFSIVRLYKEYLKIKKTWYESFKNVSKRNNSIADIVNTNTSHFWWTRTHNETRIFYMFNFFGKTSRAKWSLLAIINNVCQPLDLIKLIFRVNS